MVEDNPDDAEITLRRLKKHNLGNRVEWVKDGAAVAAHFVDEEKALAQIDYPKLAEHRDAHARLLAGARELLAAVHAGRSSPGEVVEFLAYEVVNRHILRVDRQFFPFLARSGVR